MNSVFHICVVQILLFHSFLLGFEEIQNTFIDREIDAFMSRYDIPGVAVALFDGDNDKVLCYGVANKITGAFVTENTIFELASVTKVFTTTSLALHVLDGDVALKDPISKYIPAIKTQRGASQITLLQLATHTSGLPRVGGNWHIGGADKIFQFLQLWSPNEGVPKRYAYSNLAFGLLGYTLEAVEKTSYDEIIHKEILAPLSMNRTFTQVPPSLLSHYAQGYDSDGKVAPRRLHGFIPGSGALRSTAKDMLKFLKANMGLMGPEKLVKAMRLAQEPYYKVRKDFTMGLGWQRVDIKGNTIIDKNGGVAGFTSYIGWIPKRRVGVVILTNKGKARTSQVGRDILEYLASKD